MKITESVIHAILLSTIVTALLAQFVYAFPDLSITVETSKSSYKIGEDIDVYGNLTYDDSTVLEKSVALEVQDPNNNPVVTRTLQTDNDGAYNLTFKLPTDAKLGIYTVYVSASHGGEKATNNTTFKLLQVVSTTVTVAGKGYTITTESNATITDVTATRNTLHFTSSGPTGQGAYVNTTFPVGLNKTEIRVFIDGVKLTPPPFPIITTNGTHYFIYFEFICSTHEIIIHYAIADVAITNVTPCKTVVGEGYPSNINIAIQNQGDNEESFNVTAYYNDTAIMLPNGKNYTAVTLTSGNSTIVILTWNTTGVAKGNYTITAKATPLLGETDTTDNTLTDEWVVVTIPGDVNGDKRVDIMDLATVAWAFGTGPSDTYWNPEADINNDYLTDIDDVIIVARNYGKTT